MKWRSHSPFIVITDDAKSVSSLQSAEHRYAQSRKFLVTFFWNSDTFWNYFRIKKKSPSHWFTSVRIQLQLWYYLFLSDSAMQQVKSQSPCLAKKGEEISVLPRNEMFHFAFIALHSCSCFILWIAVNIA